MSDKLIDVWTEAANDLGLCIIAPFTLVLDSGNKINARLLLKGFGHTIGMIIVTDYSSISPFTDEIIYSGYGYSTLSEPEMNECYDRQYFIDMLQDWGWSGSNELRPKWLPSDID